MQHSLHSLNLQFVIPLYTFLLSITTLFCNYLDYLLYPNTDSIACIEPGRRHIHGIALDGQIFKHTNRPDTFLPVGVSTVALTRTAA